MRMSSSKILGFTLGSFLQIRVQDRGMYLTGAGTSLFAHPYTFPFESLFKEHYDMSKYRPVFDVFDLKKKGECVFHISDQCFLAALSLGLAGFGKHVYSLSLLSIIYTV